MLSALGVSSCIAGSVEGYLSWGARLGPGHVLYSVVWGQGEGTHGGLCVVAGGPLVSTPVVPLKFSLPHMVVCFGAGGQLVLVCPHRPAEGQLAQVELHSLEVCHSPAPQTAFGPLAGVAPFALRDANTVHHPNSLLISLPVPCCHLIPTWILESASCQPVPGHCFQPSGPASCSFSSVTLVICDLFTVIPSGRDRCGPYLSEG